MSDESLSRLHEQANEPPMPEEAPPEFDPVQWASDNPEEYMKGLKAMEPAILEEMAKGQWQQFLKAQPPISTPPSFQMPPVGISFPQFQATTPANPLELDRLAMALSRAQANYKPLRKSKKAVVRMKSGGEYSYNYADLSDMIDATRGALAVNELALVQLLVGDQLVTKLLHSSGQKLESTVKVSLNLSPQEFGSFLTYYRRYTMGPILGIAAEEDDDGAAGDAGHKEQPPKSAPAAPKPAAAQTKAAPPKAQPGPPAGFTEAEKKPDPARAPALKDAPVGLENYVVGFGSMKGKKLVQCDVESVRKQKAAIEHYYVVNPTFAITPEQSVFIAFSEQMLGMLGEDERKKNADVTQPLAKGEPGRFANRGAK